MEGQEHIDFGGQARLGSLYLLLTMLLLPIVPTDSEPIADSFSEATILFADIFGVTA
jgi:hypothetical protein